MPISQTEGYFENPLYRWTNPKNLCFFAGFKSQVSISVNSCTELSKTQFFPAIIVKVKKKCYYNCHY